MTNLPTIIEEIAQQWDGCMYDSGLCGDIDIGAAIREAADKRLMLAAMSSKPEQAQEAVGHIDNDGEVFIYDVSLKGVLLFARPDPVGINGLTEAETSATASVAGLSSDPLGVPASPSGSTLQPSVSAAIPNADCPICGGTGEFFTHAANCADDLCALNGDVHSCAGSVLRCECSRLTAETLLMAFVAEVKRHAYAPQFEHMGPLVIAAEELLAEDIRPGQNGLSAAAPAVEGLAMQPRPVTNCVPGKVHCAKCGFTLVRTNLYVNSGTTGPGGEETEPCPNDGNPMLPVTWEQEAREARKINEQLFDRAIAAKKALTTHREHPAAQQERQEEPTVPRQIIEAIAAYGDERADENPNAHLHLAEAIKLIRFALAAQAQKEKP
jgi:hypothetical protein